MSGNKPSININLGAPGFSLFLVFLILKLTGVINWSWLWVTSPLWIAAAIVIGFLGLAFGVAFLVALTENKRRW